MIHASPASGLIALRAGAVVAAGPPAEVVTADLVREVFGLESLVITDPASRTPLVVPKGRHDAVTAEVA